MRVLSKPSSAKCNLNLYTLFLLAEPKAETLTLLKHQEWGFLFAIESNRLVALDAQTYVQVHRLEIPPNGVMVHLKQF